MRAVIQRSKQASVVVGGNTIAAIDSGLVILLGIEHDDDEAHGKWLAKKVANMRIFNDNNGVMNESAIDQKQAVIVISQFTLHASTKKGNRPSYIKAARPEHAVPLYHAFIKELADVYGLDVQTGEFGAHMDVHLINDGPVTISLDSQNPE